MKVLFLLLELLHLFTSSDAISCLVMRPGYGLVSEECPASSVGCRIRVSGDHIEWYEWAKLYDRNQLVCVFQEEYDQSTGCVRKPSGSVRCWCGGQSDCNNPKTSKALYEAFTDGNGQRMREIMLQLESEDDQSDETDVRNVPTLPPTVTPKPRTRPTPRRQYVKKISTTEAPTTMKIITTTTRRPTTTTTKRVITTPSDIVIHGPAGPVPGLHAPHGPTLSPPQVEKTVYYAKDDDYDDDEEEEVAKPLPTDPPLAQDPIFEETRKKLEAEMREEDERLKQILADEEKEMKNDDEKPDSKEQKKRDQEKYKIERRERAREAERRRLAEEEKLAKMEREEAEERERREQEDDEEEDSDEDEDDEGPRDGFGLTASSAISGITLGSTLISLMLSQLLLQFR